MFFMFFAQVRYLEVGQTGFLGESSWLASEVWNVLPERALPIEYWLSNFLLFRFLGALKNIKDPKEVCCCCYICCNKNKNRQCSMLKTHFTRGQRMMSLCITQALETQQCIWEWGWNMQILDTTMTVVLTVRSSKSSHPKGNPKPYFNDLYNRNNDK